MYIVRRPFRNTFGMVPAGSTVEPAGIKGFNRHLKEGHIVEVTEQNFEQYAAFFKQRYGVTLEPFTKPAEAKEEALEPTQTSSEATAKPIVKPAAEIKKVARAVQK